MKRRLLAIGFLVVPAMVLGAQTERLTIRMIPSPNQTLHVRTRTDMTMTVTPDPAADAARSMPPVATSMVTNAEHTTTVGPTDEHGHYSARVLCDSVSYTVTINGKPGPVPADMADRLVGQVVTFSYDDQGKILKVDTEGGVDPNLAAALKQTLVSAFAAAPPITLSVGESVTVPAQVNIPTPMSAVMMSTSSETRYTLTSVTFDGADRIAHLAVASTNTVSQPIGSTDARPVGLDVRTVSEGKMDVNVDRGIVLHTETRTTIDGLIQSGSQTTVPPMRTHGTMTMSADLTK